MRQVGGFVFLCVGILAGLFIIQTVEAEVLDRMAQELDRREREYADRLG